MIKMLEPMVGEIQQEAATTKRVLERIPPDKLSWKLIRYRCRSVNWPSPHRSMKLLVVEEESKTASYLKKGLAENGFVVDTASDGEEGQACRRSRCLTPTVPQ